MKLRPLHLTLIMLALLVAVPLNASEVTREINIPRLVQEAPPLDTYGDVPAVVWLREENYSFRSDGAMVKDSQWVVMMTDKLDARWAESLLSIPEPGALKVKKAELYDPVSGKLVRKLKPVFEDHKGFRQCSLDLGDHDELVLVLSFSQIYDRRFSVDGLIRPRGVLPMWEGLFSVEYPSGSDFYVKSNKMDMPESKKSAGTIKKTWSLYNLTSKKRESLLSRDEPYLAFSLRKGKVAFLQFLGSMEQRKWPDKPQRFNRLSRMGDKTRAGKLLLKAMNSSDMLIPSSEGVMRENIPSEGPWTEWEKAFLLKKWLTDMGWKADVVWFTYLPIGTGDDPATMAGLLKPVLRLAPPGSEFWFYVMGQQVEPGEIPASIRGRKLYGGTIESGLSIYEIEQGKTADHRLSIDWNVRLSPEGLLNGELQLWVRNGWIWIFPDPAGITIKKLETVLPGISSWKAEGSIKVKALDYGYRLDIPVSRMTGIPGGPGMLLRLPCLMPGAILDLASASPGELKFPFVVEQNYSIALPSGFKLLTSVPVNDRKEGELGFEEKFRFSKKHNSIEAREKLITWGSKFDEVNKMALNRLVGAWIRWKDLSVPLIKKR